MGGRDNTPTGDDCKTRCCGRNCARRPMVHHRGLAWMDMMGMDVGFEVRSGVVVCPPRRGCLLPSLPEEGPAAQGSRARRNWPSPRALVPVQGPWLLPSPSPLRFEVGDPGEGSDAAQSGCQTASVLVQPRPASPNRGHGGRRDDWGRRSEFAALLRFALAGSSRAVASLLRRTGVDVCRLHVRSPGPWLGVSIEKTPCLLARCATRD